MITVVVRRFLPIVALTALMVFLVRQQQVPQIRSDMWFHLRFGHEFLNGWSVTQPGHLGAYDSADWIATQWLTQEAMSWLESRFGIDGVVMAVGALVATLAASLYVACRRVAAPLPAVLAVALAMIVALPSLSARPQLVSYLFIVITVSAWLATARDGRPRYWLIALALLWPMFHGMWPVGISIGVASVAGIALQRDLPRSRVVRLALVPIGSALAAACTPIGLDAYRALVAVGSRSALFWEWGPPDFTVPNASILAIMLAIVILAGARSAPVEWIQVTLLLLGMAWALYSLRTTPVAGLILAPLLATTLQRWVPEAGPVTRAEAVAVSTSVLIACGILGLGLVAHSPAVVAPPWLDDQLESLPTGTKVLNDWDTGAYFLYRYPGLELAMHGYGEVFTDAELKRNIDMTRVAPGWDTEVEDLGADLALLDPDSPLAYALVNQLTWQVVERDDDFTLLRPPTPQ